MNARFLVSGDTAVAVELGDRIDREISERVLDLSARVRAAHIAGVVDTVPTYRSLLVHHDPLLIASAALIAELETLLDTPRVSAREAKLWRIPACYALTHAPDLSNVAARTGLSEDEVVRLHTGMTYHVYMIGFVPGFPYMGDLPPQLALPRRPDPRVKVQAGAVAIAAGQTAIYPLDSPGGWHLIGATPLRLFDLTRSQPALLSPGDKVRFEAVETDEFDEISARVVAGTYDVPRESIAA